MKTDVNGIEVVSNCGEVIHNELCEKINKYVKDIFAGVTSEEISRWIKIINFNEEIIGKFNTTKGYYDLDTRSITIKYEETFYFDMIIFHEIVHARIFYENRDNLKRRNVYWELINEYKTIINTNVYFLNKLIKAKSENKYMQILMMICIEVFDDLKKDNNKICFNEKWYMIARISSALYLFEKYKKVVPVEANVTINDISTLASSHYPYLNEVVRICKSGYVISKLEVNLLMCTKGLVLS